MAVADGELLRKIDADRDAEAFAAFYDRFAARAYGLLLKLLRNRTDADDVLQETFIQVWNRAGRFDPARSTPEGWILMLTRSRALDRLRKRPTTSTTAIPEAGIETEPGLGLHAAESAAELDEGLAELPPDQRDPIRLAFFEGCTHEEIAKRLQLPLGTVKTRIRLGMIRLRERFRTND